jgi:hypothetical protein
MQRGIQVCMQVACQGVEGPVGLRNPGSSGHQPGLWHRTGAPICIAAGGAALTVGGLRRCRLPMCWTG